MPFFEKSHWKWRNSTGDILMEWPHSNFIRPSASEN